MTPTYDEVVQAYRKCHPYLKSMYTKKQVQTILQTVRYGWSRQGLGMLRLYLDAERIYRLHVWDSSLKIPGVSPMHTHPWDLESTVIAGVYQQRRYSYDLSDVYEPWMSFSKVRIKCGSGACTKTEPEMVQLRLLPVETVLEGGSYTQHASEIHESFPLDGTVTIVKRTFQEDTEHADVFWRGSGGWVDAAPEIVPSTSKTLEDVIERALKTWF